MWTTARHAAILTVALFALTGIMSAQRSWVGVIESDTVWLDNFSREVGRLTEYAAMKPGGMPPGEVIETAWMEALNHVLIGREAAAMGLQMPLSIVDSIILADPPQFLKNGIVDENGKFDAALLAGMLHNPDSVVRARVRPGTTGEQQRRAIETMRTSMDDMRRRYRDVLLRQQIEQLFADTFTPDSAALVAAFARAASRCTADLVMIPCMSTRPVVTDDALKSYYELHKNEPRYTATKPLRRVAYLSFPVRATSRDSAEVLDGVKRFLMDYRTSGAARRDSIMRSLRDAMAVETMRVTATDSAARPLYKACTSMKKGDVAGPFMTARGIAVIRLDTVMKVAKTKDYGITFIATAVEPGQRTVDSILQQVNSVIDAYEGGTELGETARRVNKTIELSDVFSTDDRPLGSYRLADVAFSTQVSAMCEPVDVPELGVVLAVVIDSITPGPLPYEIIEQRIEKDYVDEQNCVATKRVAEGVQGISVIMDDGMFVVPERPQSSTLMRGISIERSGIIADSLFDARLAEAVYATAQKGLLPVIQGDNGWYVVNVKERVAPEPREFSMWFDVHGKDYVDQQRAIAFEQQWTERLTKLKVVDNRWMYFRY
jgi:hypothetical protein